MSIDNDLRIAECGYCGQQTTTANVSSCPICETFTNACADCMGQHRHTPQEIDAARAEALA